MAGNPGDLATGGYGTARSGVAATPRDVASAVSRGESMAASRVGGRQNDNNNNRPNATSPQNSGVSSLLNAINSGARLGADAINSGLGSLYSGAEYIGQNYVNPIFSGIGNLIAPPAQAGWYGANAKNADLLNLGLARGYEFFGADPTMTLEKTGWLKDPLDNQWKYYNQPAEGMTLNLIQKRDDRAPQLPNVDSKRLGWDMKVSDYFSYPDLAENYPAFNDIELITRPSGSVYKNAKLPNLPVGKYQIPENYMAGAAFNPRDKSIEMGDTSSRYFGGYDNGVERTMAHELEHFTQNQEGFPMGGGADWIAQGIKQYSDTKKKFGSNSSPQSYNDFVDIYNPATQYGALLDRTGYLDDYESGKLPYITGKLYRSEPSEIRAEEGAFGMENPGYVTNSTSFVPEWARLPSPDRITQSQMDQFVGNNSSRNADAYHWYRGLYEKMPIK